MGILARLLGAVPKGERGGIRLQDSEYWEVGATKDVERFVRALPLLELADALMYFEDTGEAHVADYLSRVSIPAVAQVAIGTIWPRPDSYHVPLTMESVEALARFLEEKPAGLFCSHCHVYRDGAVLLEWYDAFGDDPLRISHTVPETVVDAFAQTLGSRYRRTQDD